MFATLRRLELKLAKQLAQLIVQEQTEKLLARWHRATDDRLPLPDPFDFLRKISRAGYYVQHGSYVQNYLTRCADEHTIPDNRILYQCMLPWRYPIAWFFKGR